MSLVLQQTCASVHHDQHVLRRALRTMVPAQLREIQPTTEEAAREAERPIPGSLRLDDVLGPRVGGTQKTFKVRNPTQESTSAAEANQDSTCPGHAAEAARAIRC